MKHHHSAGGIIIHDNKVLTLHSKIRGSIGFPKGKIEPGEDIAETAIREVKEESGYDVKILQLIGDSDFEFEQKGELVSKTVTYFLMALANDNAPEPDLQAGEDFISTWMPIDEALEALTFDDAKEMLRRALV